MRRVGDDAAGFSVDVDADKEEVHVVGWGFWNAQVAQEFDQVVVGECRRAPSGSRLLLDMSDLKPMRDEGQKAFSTMVRMLQVLDIRHTSVKTASQLTKLQLMRIALEAGQTQIQFI